MNIHEFCDMLSVNLYPKQIEILDEFYNSNCRELIAVLGRRSGKDFLGAIMALYAAYHLLELDDPFTHYRIARGNPIYMLLISCSNDQSRIMFNEVKTMAKHSDYFRKKIGKIESDRIWFLTPEDEKYNKKMLFSSQTHGSVCILSSGANSESLLGKRTFALILNEIAFFKNPERTYSMLTPATCDFRSESGHLDSRIITLTSASTSDNIVHRLTSEPSDYRMVFQLATWEVNPYMDRDTLRSENSFMTDEEFDSEFGAVFRSMETNQTISMRLPVSQIEVLKRAARLKAFEQNKDISYTDLIRECVENYTNRAQKSLDFSV